MKFSRGTGETFGWEGLQGQVYSTGDDFAELSSSYIEITTAHGPTMSTASNRLYYVIDGKGEFQLRDEKFSVVPTDVVIVPKNTPYDYWATTDQPLKLLLVQDPAFDADAEVKVEL